MDTEIQKLLDRHPGQNFSVADIVERLKIKKDYTTVYRVLRKMLQAGKVKKIGLGKNTRYQTLRSDIDDYFEQPFFDRKKASYNKEFLEGYIPNQSFFLSEQDRKVLYGLNKNVGLSTDFITANRRLYETLLIDLSYSSSYLEGNTYSYLDTEVLIKYGEEAEGKTKEESQMVLNHKRAIEYMMNIAKNKPLTSNNFLVLHSLLGEGLIEKEALGVIRKNLVGIGGSSYKPLDNPYQLEDEFRIFIDKLNQIKDPFEQAFFILVFIPYFQLFKDINKRVSRISCNIPLIKNNLIPFSFLMVNKKDYVVGLLAVYELNDVSGLREVFLIAYKKAYKRYFE